MRGTWLAWFFLVLKPVLEYGGGPYATEALCLQGRLAYVREHGMTPLQGTFTVLGCIER